jgi:hypothetical protein
MVTVLNTVDGKPLRGIGVKAGRSIFCKRHATEHLVKLRQAKTNRVAHKMARM